LSRWRAGRTGDLIDNPAGVESMARAARLFRPRIGAFAVLGGHDYRRYGLSQAYARLLSGTAEGRSWVANPAGALKDALAAEGVQVLEDAAHVVHGVGQTGLVIVGLQDAFLSEPDYAGAWAGVPEGMPVVVLSHSPDVRPELAARGVRLALCGHTHGGQVRFPIVGALVTRSSLPGRLASGTFRSGPTTYVIGNGLGTSPVTPFRLLCRPEAVIVDIAASPAAEEIAHVEEADGV
jgi:predicted MPP superfamily phosphohydrolase